MDIHDELDGHRRRALKRIGKTIFRRTDGFFARESLIPDRPVLDPETFLWTAALERSFESLRAEAEAILRHRDRLLRFQDLSPYQGRISADDRWRVLVFYGFGQRSDANCRLCPRTAALLDRIPDLESAFLSILAPGKHVPRHRGVTRGIVRCHVGLIVPADGQRCRMVVDDTTVHWQEGRAVVFDDSRPHEVWNDAASERVVLLIDVRRPMRRRGKVVLDLLIRLLRRTSYVRGAVDNERAWESRYGHALRASIGAHP